MADENPKLESLFLAALELESPQERSAFLDRECGADQGLRGEVERLLCSNEQAGSFLEKPVVQLAATLAYLVSERDRTAALDAGLAATFDGEQQVVVGRAGVSVLKNLTQSVEAPRVVLRDPASDGAAPVVRSASSQLPERESDSRYQLQGEIARGGMGAILKGRDTDLGRELAIKVLLDEHKANPEVVQRFIEEAQIGGQLQHPGIAPVYELGQFADQRPFFSMKLVKGETLSKLLAARSDVADERPRFIGIFEQICQTIAYAHSRGVIHRDLKPANIMVGAFGEVQVMDWGLAKVLQSGGVVDERKARDELFGNNHIRTLRQPGGSHHSATPGAVGSTGAHTQMGSVMGTPAYMPPEQALGKINTLDERADVFGLGAILCEILTGKPPYVGENGTVVYRMAMRGQLEECFKRIDACDVDPELLAIAKHCLAPDATDRPREASVLAARISSYLASVEARLRTSELDRAAEAARAEEALRTVSETQARAKAEQRARRLQLVVAVAGLVVVSIGGVAAFSSAIHQRELKFEAVEARTKADAERQRADESREKADELRAEAVAAAEREQRLATQAREAQLREAEMRSLSEERERVTQATLYASQMILATQAAEEPSGLRRMGEIIDGWRPDQVIRDLRGWEWYFLDSLRRLTRRSVAHASPMGAKWSPDGTRFVTYGHDQWLRLWKGDGAELQFEVHAHQDYIYEVDWNPAGTQLATAGRDGKLKIWDARTGQAIGAAYDCGQSIDAVRWSPDGTRLMFKGEHEVGVLAADTLQVLQRWETPVGEQNVAWHPSLDRIAMHGAVMDAKTGERLWSHSDPFVEWSPDGTRLATAGFESARILAAADGRELATLAIPSGSILAIAWNPQGTALAIGLRDSSLRIWDPQSKQSPVILRGHLGGVRHVSWNREGTLIASTSTDAVKLWDWPPRINPSTISCRRDFLFEVAWSEDGQTLVANNDHLEFWSRGARTHERSVFLGAGGLVNDWSQAVSWHEKTHGIATLRDGKLVLLDDRTGDPRLELPHDCDSMRSLAFNPDGTRLATSNYRTKNAVRHEHGEVCVYDVATGGLVWKRELHGDRAGGLSWSPDGRRLACSGWTSGEIVSAEDGQSLCQSQVAADLGWIHDMSWSPDGERLVMACLNHTLCIIDTRTGREIKKLVGHTGPVRSVSWSPDGQRIASGSGDKSVRIWNATSGLQVLALREHAVSVESVRWSPDGQQLAAGSARGQLLVFDARIGAEWEQSSPPPVDPVRVASTIMTPADAELELERLAKQLEATPADPELFNARGSLLARLGRWTDSANAYSQIAKLTPNSRYGWGMASTPMLMAGEHDRYREHCREMVERFKGTTEADIADTVCKTALLLPEVVPLSDLPIDSLRKGIDDPKWEPFRPWFIACAALISYREGRPEDAVRWTTKMPDLRSQPGTLALVVRAMSEFQLAQPAAARESLKAAELQIPLPLRTLGTSGDSTPLPTPLGIVDHDWIVPEILRREAEKLISGK